MGDQRAELVGQRLDPGLEGTQSADEVAGELLAGGRSRRDGTDTTQQNSGLTGGQSGFRAAGDQVAQQPVQPVHTAGVLGHQVVAMVADQANHAGQVLGLDLAKAPMVLGDQSNGRRVVDVGLAALPGESSRARAAKVAGTSTTSSP